MGERNRGDISIRSENSRGGGRIRKVGRLREIGVRSRGGISSINEKGRRSRNREGRKRIMGMGVSSSRNVKSTCCDAR